VVRMSADQGTNGVLHKGKPTARNTGLPMRGKLVIVSA
jgi:hypothetical protein